jgi:prolyl oligopeptidase
VPHRFPRLPIPRAAALSLAVVLLALVGATAGCVDLASRDDASARRAASAAASAASASSAARVAASAPSAPAPGYPVAARHPVSHTYHGVTVSDDFEWLERGDDPATRDWVAAENVQSRRWLDDVPVRAALHDRFRDLARTTSNAYDSLAARGGWVFALKTQPPRQHPLLVRMKSVDDPGSEQVVFDPNTAAPDGSLAIDFFAPSNDGRRVAISVSVNGSEDGTLRIVDAATGQDLGDRVPRAAYPTGGGSVAWAAGDTGFFYTRYPAPGERAEDDLHFFQQVWFHALGTPAERDRYETGKAFPRIAETTLRASTDGRFTTALVENGDGTEYAVWLHDARDAHAGWRRIADHADGLSDVRIGDDGALYLLSRRGAPKGRLLRLDPSRLGPKPVDWAHVPVVAPEGEGAITDYVAGGGQLFVADLVGGPSRLRAIDLRTRRASTVPLPDIASVDNLADLGRGQVLAQVQTYLVPRAWMHVAAGRAPRRSGLFVTAPVSFGDCEVVREFATSKDGTKVPLNIVRRKGVPLDGANAVILYGYGGYGVSETPAFDASLRPWLDRGGLYVDANLRGSGEYGQAWHTAGHLVRKQNVFDDFVAVAQYLVARGYTRPGRLGIWGGSNGGLLMGAVVTQHPELFRAVLSQVGIYDMLRVELDPNGAFNTTEFGSVKDPAQFAALYAYSPLHHVKDGTRYPAILMMTGDNDGRVNPAHSRKMIARLQAADPHGRPILLHTSATSGHGFGTSIDEKVDDEADEFAFFIDQLMLH